MNSAKTAIAIWKTQYYLSFNQSGIGFDFSGTVITINGKEYGSSGLGVWATLGDVYNYTYSSILPVDWGKQYSLTSVNSTNSLSFMVTQPITIVGIYNIQYCVIVTSAHGTPLPSSTWFDAGTEITESITSTIIDGSETRYICTGWVGYGSIPRSGTMSPFTFTLNEPSALTWNFNTQYLIRLGVNSEGQEVNFGEIDIWQGKVQITISAPSINNSRFSFWTADTNSIYFENYTSDSTTATINGPGSITAYFAGSNMTPSASQATNSSSSQSLSSSTQVSTPPTPKPSVTPQPSFTPTPSLNPSNPPQLLSSSTPIPSVSPENGAFTNPSLFSLFAIIIIVSLSIIPIVLKMKNVPLTICQH